MKKLVSMRTALSDDELLGDALKGDTWSTWRVLLIAAVGEELTEDERIIFRQFTGRDVEPGAMIDTWLTVSGRRSGKTTAMAALVVFVACLCDWTDDLALGERGAALYLAPTQDQALRAFRYARAFIQNSPLMKKLVSSEVADGLALSNGIDIEISAANWRHVRGVTAIVVVLDECAFFRNEADSANRDQDLISALRPSLVTTGGPMLLISSPGTDQGVVHAIHRRHFGPQGGDPLMLVVQSDSRSLNPRLDAKRIDREYTEDPESAQAEWGGQFRAPTSQWLPRTVIERAVTTGVVERPPMKLPSQYRYYAFCDAAGGEGKDSFTLCIGRHDHERQHGIVVDLVREVRPPFNSETAVEALASVLKAYGIRQVVGDQYAKGWPTQAFARHQIEYVEHAPVKSDLYLHCIPLFTADRVKLVDSARLVDQLCGLRRKVGQGGKETVDHLRNGHDDIANSVCGVLWRLSPVQDTDVKIVAPIVIVGGVRVEAQPLTGEAARRATAADVQSEIEQIHREASGYAAGFSGGSGGGTVGYGWRRFDHPGW